MDEEAAITAMNTNSERIKRIHQRVRKVKTSVEAGVRYMQAWEERYHEREEARNEGIEQGIKALVLDYIEEEFDKDKIIKKLQKRDVYKRQVYSDILDSGDSFQKICLQFPHQGHLHIQITVDHLRRQTKPGNPRNIFRPGTDILLLFPSEHDRFYLHLFIDINKSGSLRPMNLMSAGSQQDVYKRQR